MFSYGSRRWAALVLTVALAGHGQAQDSVQGSIPSIPDTPNVVDANFFGVSFELSFMNEYFGNDTSTIPQTMMNYLSNIRSRTGNFPVRIRIGGNSADTSSYVSEQTSPMVQLTDPNANANNQPVNYGPMLWEVMQQVSDEVGGVEYLIGLSLDAPNNTNAVIAGAARSTLGSSLDSMLLGNEPDLYTAHRQRPELQNYTVDDYIREFRAQSQQLQNTSAGNLLTANSVSGPTICCQWDLASLLEGGYLSNFTDILKYITLQHYPQNNCFGGHEYEIPYYLSHSNVVDLASWQQHGIVIVHSNTSAQAPRVLMSEFNSASCGGVPNISDTFAVGSMWTVDYVLQMASVGYSAAYIHTRETGISYNLVALPADWDVNGSWTTNPSYYSLLVSAEIMQSDNGTIVVDMDLNGSRSNNSTQAGYVVYDASSRVLTRVVLFNFGDSAAHFDLPSDLGNGTSEPLDVKFLSSSGIEEKWNISWDGQTFAGVGDGRPVDANGSWAAPNTQLNCQDGCGLDVPGPAIAVIFINPAVQDGDSVGQDGDNATTDINRSLSIMWTFCLLGIVMLLL